MTEPLALDLKKAAEIAGCSVGHLRNEWRAHRLSFKNKGTASNPFYIVMYAELKRWLDEEVPAAVPGRRAS